MTLSDLKSYWVSVDGIQTADVCIPPEEAIAANQRIRIISIDWLTWMNAITNYLTVAYSTDAGIVRVFAIKSSANTGVQQMASKVFPGEGVALPWGYKFVIAWSLSAAAHHASCCVNYRIETLDSGGELAEMSPVVPEQCSMLERMLGQCGGSENVYY